MNARFTSTTSFDEILKGREVLKIGDKGPAVRVLQEALRDMGFPMLVLQSDTGVSGVDGAFGGQTETALKNFQVHANRKHPDVSANGILDIATMRALIALAPVPGKRSWDAGQPNHAPSGCWNGEPSKKLRIVVVKDEHRTFLFDPDGGCISICPNAHGTAGSGTDTGLKTIRTKLNESQAKAVGKDKWDSDRAFGRRILDLGWASGKPSGEELHGTYDYRNMGKDVSHGCVRHYNEDIITIFDTVNVGEYVAIVPSIDDPSLRAPVV